MPNERVIEERSLSVRERIDMIDEQIDRLKQKRREIIDAEPASFRYLNTPPTFRAYGNERYFTIYGDGSFPRYLHPRTQRPQALSAARISGFYVYDAREKVVLDADGNVLKRLEAA